MALVGRWAPRSESPVSSFWNEILADLFFFFPQRVGARCLSGSLDECQGSGMFIHANMFAANFGKFKTLPNGEGEVFKRPRFWKEGKGLCEHPEGGDYCRCWQRGNGMPVSPLSDFSYLLPAQGWGVGQSQGRDSTQGSGRPLQAEEARLNLVTLVGSTPTPPLQGGRNHLPECGRCFSSSRAGQLSLGWTQRHPLPRGIHRRKAESEGGTAVISWILNSAFHKTCFIAVTLAKFKLPLFSGLRNPLREKGEIFKVRNEKWWGEEGSLWSRLKEENCFWS